MAVHIGNPSILAAFGVAFGVALLTLTTLFIWSKHDPRIIAFIIRNCQDCYDLYERLGFLLNGRTIIAKKYRQADGEPFHVKTPSNKMIIISSDQHLLELSSSPSSKLSLHAVAKELLQPKYTMQGFEWHDERGVESMGFVRALRSHLTAHLPTLQPKLASAIAKGLATYVENHTSSEGVASVRVFDMIKTIVSQANCLMFFGETLANDVEFVTAALRYAENVVVTAEVLRTVPRILRPALAALIASRQQSSKKLFHNLLPEVSQRLEFRARARDTPDYSKRVPMDCVQWLIDTSPIKEPWTPQRMVHEIMAIWFSSFHQLAMVLTTTVQDLCLHLEYIEPLRNEIQDYSREHHMDPAQTSDPSMSRLELLESFITESSRRSPLDAVSVRRKALVDLTMFDGTFIAKDNWVCCTLDSMMADSQFWQDPETFDGFRFARTEVVEKRLQREIDPARSWHEPSRSSSQIKFTDTAHPWVMWGSGDKACPGRFYSSMIIKLVMARIVQGYDLCLKDVNAPRTFQWRTSIVPREDTIVNLCAR